MTSKRHITHSIPDKLNRPYSTQQIATTLLSPLRSTFYIMSTTSTHTSPASEHHTLLSMPFQLSRDQFSIEMPSPRLSATNGNGALKTPNSLASPTDRRAQSFSRDGILGSAQKTRGLSQSSQDRNANHFVSNQNSNSNGSNSGGKDSGDDGINPLKRKSTDGGNDYPRRRATIAVSYNYNQHSTMYLY